MLQANLRKFEQNILCALQNNFLLLHLCTWSTCSKVILCKKCTRNKTWIFGKTQAFLPFQWHKMTN